MRRSVLLVALTLAACSGEARAVVPVEPEQAPAMPEPSPPETPAPSPPGQVIAPDPFAIPLPEAACPERARVAIAHANAEGLPTWLEGAVAFRSEDGRQIRVAIANHPLERDAAGRFPAPAAGQARFEMDATRARRGRLEPRVLGTPEALRGGLTHARIVAPHALLTFGHRNIGQVEITEIGDDHVCGRIALDDGFGRVRGAFRAPIVGPLPD
ncbi:MAG: hypothetical protein R3B82_24425 [Sandaracinaceae bacterium]